MILLTIFWALDRWISIIDADDRAAILISSASQNSCEELKAELKKGVNPSAVFNGQSLLERAIAVNNPCCVKLLVAASADTSTLGPANKKLLMRMMK